MLGDQTQSFIESEVERLTPPGEGLIALGDDPEGFFRQFAYTVSQFTDPLLREELEFATIGNPDIPIDPTD